jgi:GNAT superfamily N-acetyltransferase
VPAVDTACRKAGLDPHRVGVVARLLVASDARLHGVGRHLLARAATEAHRCGLLPVLDVAKQYEAAVTFYEACQWTRAADLTLRLGDGLVIESWLYVGPTT